MEQPLCRACGGRISWTAGMVACLPDESLETDTCIPVCRACGRELVPDDRAPDRDRGRRHWRNECWRNECGCVVEREPDPDYGFSGPEVARFKDLLIIRGCEDEVADALAGRLLNSLAHHGTKVVLDMPRGDIVISGEEGADAVGRELRTAAEGSTGVSARSADADAGRVRSVNPRTRPGIDFRMAPEQA